MFKRIVYNGAALFPPTGKYWIITNAAVVLSNETSEEAWIQPIIGFCNFLGRITIPPGGEVVKTIITPPAYSYVASHGLVYLDQSLPSPEVYGEMRLCYFEFDNE